MPGSLTVSDPSPRARRRRHSWARVLLPALLILAWLAGASLGGPLFGRIDEVSSNDRTAYLPESADATRVQEALGDGGPGARADAPGTSAGCAFGGGPAAGVESLSTGRPSAGAPRAPSARRANRRRDRAGRS